MQEPTPPTPPVPPTPPTPPAIPGTEGFVVTIPTTGAGPAEVLAAFRAQRRELSTQLERLEGRRSDIARRIQQGAEGQSRKGLEERLAEIDKRIADVDRQIAQADVQVAQAAAVPGAAVEPRQPPRNGPPEEVFIIPIVFIVFVLFPLTIAFVRRLWRRPAPPTPVSPEFADRLSRIEQAVDTVAVEVERIGEGQRFLSRVFANPATVRQLETLAAQGEEKVAARP